MGTLGGRREQGGNHVDREELVEMADLQREFGNGAEALPKALGAWWNWQGCRGGWGWACLGKGDDSFMFIGCVRRSVSLPSDLSWLHGLGKGQQD